MIEPEVREQLIGIVRRAKPKLSVADQAALIDAIGVGCEKAGIAIVDEDQVLGTLDDHLALLKRMRRTIADKTEGEISGRDLAALSRRLQDVSKEITAIEEKISADQRRRGGGNGNTSTTKASSDSKEFDPAAV